MAQYARGKYAFGFCDVCGFRTPLNEMRQNVFNLKPTGIRTCRTCWDPDHPQLQAGRYKVFDPQTLQNARPDSAQAASRGGGIFLATEDDVVLATESDEPLET